MFDDVAAFPLCWPDGWVRTKNPIDGRFKQTVYSATQNLQQELTRMGGQGIILSTSVPLRRDGLPLSRPPADGDHGAAVYFKRNGQNQCLACDRYKDVADNIQALAKSIEALRGLERWGSSDLLDRAFMGFSALPSGTKPWYEVLGFSGPPETLDLAQDAYRKLIKENHPDTGGDSATAATINAAWETAQEMLA